MLSAMRELRIQLESHYDGLTLALSSGQQDE